MRKHNASQRVQQAITTLVLGEPFFGALALRLAVVEDPTCKTAWVDGRTMGYNPTYVDGLTQPELVGLVIHEVKHCALGHPWRRAGRDPKRWNVACDFAINPLVIDSGFVLPEGALLDDQWRGHASEWIFDRLPQDQQGGQPQQDQAGDGAGQKGGAPGEPGDEGAEGEGDDGAGQGEQEAAGSPEGDDEGEGGGEASPEEFGEVRDAPADAGEDETEAAWQQAVQQAAVAAKRRGSLSAGLERFAQQVAEPRVDWRSVLRRFVSEVARSDYSWVRPNQRYIAGGLYLPALRSEDMGPLAVVVDTSGSIDEVTLAQFGGEINAIAEDMQPQRVHVIYADARVNRIDTFERGDAIEMHLVGGGGTDFAPAFEAMRDLDDQPVCAVYLTDLDGSFPAREPEWPVLWATTWKEEAPFGEVVPMKM